MTVKKISVTLQVTNEVEARELNEAWQEIVTGKKLARAEALEHGVEAVMERARPALETIETALREHPTTGQAGRLVRFLAGGDRELHGWMKDYRIQPALRLEERQAEVFAKLKGETGHDRDELLREAIDLLLDKHRRGASGAKA